MHQRLLDCEEMFIREKKYVVKIVAKIWVRITKPDSHKDGRNTYLFKELLVVVVVDGKSID